MSLAKENLGIIFAIKRKTMVVKLSHIFLSFNVLKSVKTIKEFYLLNYNEEYSIYGIPDIS